MAQVFRYFTKFFFFLRGKVDYIFPSTDNFLKSRRVSHNGGGGGGRQKIAIQFAQEEKKE